MFRNYLKIAYRNLFKNPLGSFINVFGLSVALGICLVVFAFMEYDYSIDQFHVNKEKVYLTTFFSNRDGVMQQYGLAPRPLGEMMKADFPQVKKTARIEDRNVVVKYNDDVFRERLRYTDPQFLEMLTFPMKWGSERSLSEQSSIILSHDTSAKYFGDENPIGKELLVILDDDSRKTFTVTGVAEEFPKSHDIGFDFLVNFENIRIAEQDYDSEWGTFASALFVEIEDPLAATIVEDGMEKYRALQNQVQPDWTVASFRLERLATLHERAAFIKDAVVHDDNVEGRIGMPIIAIFMIVLACLNYINIAIVSAAKRLKEIGVRKVIGANRAKVAIQFVTENVVITSFAMAIGFALAKFVFIPWFVQFSGWQLELSLLSEQFYIFIIALLIVTGVISGVYPAVYISRFDAVNIFKGSLKFGRNNPLTKIFLVVQLVVACIAITGAVVFTQNNTFQYSRSWGYNQKLLLYANIPDGTTFERMKASMIANADVVTVAGSKDHLGRTTSTAILRRPSGEQFEVTKLKVDANYFTTMELQLKDGRGFNEHSENDRRSLVVNETFAKNIGVDPIGLQFEVDSAKFEVIGVMKDFHNRNLFHKIQPTVFVLSEDEESRYITIRVREGSELESFNELQASWAKIYPEIPFQGGHQEDVWVSYFYSVERSETFNNIIASIAVVLAALGLYGLVTLNVSGRIREFSIRKTLGAGVHHISSVVTRQYVGLTIVAMAIGAPASYVFIKAYLDMLFAYPVPMNILSVAFSMLLLVLVMVAVISTQIFKLFRLNPVAGLKGE